MAQADLDNQHDVINLLRKAWKLDQENPRISVKLGLLLLKKGLRTQAENVLNKFLLNSSGSSQTAYYIGLAHYLMDRQDCANFFLNSSRSGDGAKDWPDYEKVCG